MIAALADHLWQSTLLTGAAGMLTLMLRHNGARARFWLWFAASLKFLLPFTLLAMVICPLPSGPGTIILEPWKEIWNGTQASA